MISIIAILYEEDRHLPQRRVELYELCMDILLNRWDLKRKIKNKYDEKAKEKILRKIALEFHILEKKTFTKEEILLNISKNLPDVNIGTEEAENVLNEIVKRNALIKEISIDNYEFIHLSFQEYLAALELREQKNFKLLLKHLNEPWWIEVIQLFGGFDRDATELIQQIHNKEKIDINFKEDIFYGNLLLLGKCIVDADFTNQEIKNQIAIDLWQVYQISEFSSVKNNIINILSIIKPQEIINLNLKDLEDIEPVIRNNAALALSYIGNEKAIEPLKYALANDKEINVRSNAAVALGNIKSEKIIEPLIQALATDKASDVRFSAARGLNNTGNEKAIDAIIKFILIEKGNHVKKILTVLLLYMQNKISEKSIELLINTLTTDKESYSREIASLILGFSKTEKAIEPLIKALVNDEDERVRYRVVEALGNIGNEKVIDQLIKALTNYKQNQDVRAIAAKILGNIKSEKAVESLIKSLATDKISAVRRRSAEALGNIKSEKAIEPLLQALATDKIGGVRASASEALGKIGNIKVIEPLVNVLFNDNVSDVRASAATALGNIKSEEIIESLIKVLITDKTNKVRRSAAVTLGKIGKESAIEPLICVLKEEDMYSADIEIKNIIFDSLEKISRRTKKRITIESLKMS